MEGKKKITSHSSALVSKVNPVHSLHRMGLTVFVVAEQQTSLLSFFPFFFAAPQKQGAINAAGRLVQIESAPGSVRVMRYRSWSRVAKVIVWYHAAATKRPF